MMPRTQLVLAFLLLAPVTGGAGEVLDRIVATVDSRVITASEWEDAVRVESFLEERPLASATAQNRRATLERLIDQALLEAQMDATGFPRSSEEEASARLRDVRAHLPEVERDADWQARLAQYNLTEAILAERLGRQLALERYVDQRFRPNVFVDPASIETYYRETLVPQLRHKNAAVPPLASVRDQIERLLTEQRVNELLASWLQATRAQARIEVR